MKKTLLIGLLLLGALFIYKYFSEPAPIGSSSPSSMLKQDDSNDDSKDDSKSEFKTQSNLNLESGSSEPTKNPGNSERSLAAESNSNITALSETDRKKLDIIFEIFKSKNDNDPRFDSQLKSLSTSLKKVLAEEYSKLSPEKRNEKGTVAFLISREIKTLEDLEFLKTIYEESPCLSMNNCKELSRDQDPHHAGLEEVSLNYPQLVTLYQIEKQLADNASSMKNPRIRQEVRTLLEKALSFSVPKVKDKAQEIINTYSW